MILTLEEINLLLDMLINLNNETDMADNLEYGTTIKNIINKLKEESFNKKTTEDNKEVLTDIKKLLNEVEK